ncbi:FMN-linked oxidoreductase [Lophiostoma macrostomum CBS 122681]|uniref:Dihydroorotate dehydrogenase (fumarate) n=1 Tax=Lophiostoma macrostomum CBS 122681 TaxID=1314788 RepID=A0A6A6SYR6_9PLEO|nr:FMN-linked oxidoreductase [Lophiostoma macrostomum CBS 122681]
MPHRVKPLVIDPPLLNSANPWCSTLEQLRELYECRFTGAVTTRTSLLEGFAHDPTLHQFAFYNPTTHDATSANPTLPSKPEETGSLNTLGYSPKPLQEYLSITKDISDSSPGNNHPKPIIISVTGTPSEVVESYRLICAHQSQVCMRLAMEVNLSCPNIPSKPPPAYNPESLLTYLSALKSEVHGQLADRNIIHVPIGIKTPPYTYTGQFQSLINALVDSANEVEPKTTPCPISFITATNTLGSSLLLTPQLGPDVSEASSISIAPGGDDKRREVFHHTLYSATGTGIGGLAGAPLHPLALGNVYTIKGMLSRYKELEHIQIIGVGGVRDSEGYQRMRAVGAAAVGLGTELGRRGVAVFKDIWQGVESGNDELESCSCGTKLLREISNDHA